MGKKFGEKKKETKTIVSAQEIFRTPNMPPQKEKGIKNMNRTKNKIDALYRKIAPLNNEIRRLEDEEMIKVQRPRIQKMVGFCLRSTYETGAYYGKILDLVESKDGSLEFILEVCHITEQGNPYMNLDNVSPYLNKEWWDAEVPISGWERCSEVEYQTFKARIVQELSTQKSLRKFIQRIR